MNKWIIALLLVSRIAPAEEMLPLGPPQIQMAQGTPAEQTEEQQVPEVIVMESEPPPAPVDTSYLQNWLFAAGSIIVGTIAALIVGWSQGSPP